MKCMFWFLMQLVCLQPYKYFTFIIRLFPALFVFCYIHISCHVMGVWLERGGVYLCTNTHVLYMGGEERERERICQGRSWGGDDMIHVQC